MTEIPWWWIGCAAVAGAGAVIAGMGTLYGFRLAHRCAPGAAVAHEGLQRRDWWIVPSFCDRCGRRLPAMARQPLIGWLFGCVGCGSRGPVLYVSLEAIGALLGGLAWAAYGWSRGLAVMGVLLWIGFASAVAGADRARSTVPLTFSIGLLGLGLVASPVSEWWLRAGAAGAFAGTGLLVLWMEARRRAPPAHGGMGGADVLMAAALGGWLGPWGVCALLGALAVFPVTARSGHGPFGPHVAVSGSVVFGTLLALELF